MNCFQTVIFIQKHVNGPLWGMNLISNSKVSQRLLLKHILFIKTIATCFEKMVKPVFGCFLATIAVGLRTLKK